MQKARIYFLLLIFVHTMLCSNMVDGAPVKRASAAHVQTSASSVSADLLRIFFALCFEKVNTPAGNQDSNSGESESSEESSEELQEDLFIHPSALAFFMAIIPINYFLSESFYQQHHSEISSPPPDPGRAI